jgi:hypothetical protein
MGKLWQAVLLLIAVIVLIGLVEQVIRAALPWVIGTGLVAGGVWLALRLYRGGRGGW